MPELSEDLQKEVKKAIDEHQANNNYKLTDVQVEVINSFDDQLVDDSIIRYLEAVKNMTSQEKDDYDLQYSKLNSTVFAKGPVGYDNPIDEGDDAMDSFVGKPIASAPTTDPVAPMVPAPPIGTVDPIGASNATNRIETGISPMATVTAPTAAKSSPAQDPKNLGKSIDQIFNDDSDEEQETAPVIPAVAKDPVKIQKPLDDLDLDTPVPDPVSLDDPVKAKTNEQEDDLEKAENEDEIVPIHGVGKTTEHVAHDYEGDDVPQMGGAWTTVRRRYNANKALYLKL